MHNKKKCKNCKYSGRITSKGLVYCNYLTLAGDTCLKRDKEGNIYDSRGADSNNCALYVKGKAQRKSITIGVV